VVESIVAIKTPSLSCLVGRSVSVMMVRTRALDFRAIGTIGWLMVLWSR